LNDIAEKIDGSILQGSESLSFQRFNIDSRTTEPGELFFALSAKRNGYDFVPSAVKRGASGAVISKQLTLADKNIALIQVQDTLKALQDLARREDNNQRVYILPSLTKIQRSQIPGKL
jgi:UDP-N-acetylmuramoyl-tripeptide--D-alanyl-D-alanine ligase